MSLCKVSARPKAIPLRVEALQQLLDYWDASQIANDMEFTPLM
jgi:hypothetical protein